MFKKTLRLLAALSLILSILSSLTGMYLLLARNVGVCLHLRTGSRHAKGNRRFEFLFRFKNSRGRPIVVPAARESSADASPEE